MLIGESFGSVLEAARAGGDWAWQRIYRSLAPGLLGYFRAQGAPDAEDLTGEVFLSVVRGLSGFEGDERAFRAWVFVIAHHRLTDDRRRRGSRKEILTTDEELHRAAASGDVEQDAARNLGAEEVRRVIDRLPEGQREVMLLRMLGGLTLPEVAEATGRRKGAVKSLQHRAIGAIRRMIEAEGAPS